MISPILLSILTGLVSFVNPFVGTSNFGATNPGALLPNGMMSVSPFNVSGSARNTWDKDSRWWSTPYSSDNCYLTGFSHVNLSGVGCPDMGAVLVMPTAGELEVDYTKYGSLYEDEMAEPGYYSVVLSDYGIQAEVTATLRSSIERYTFPEGRAKILLNLGEALTNETGAFVRRVSDTEVEGMRLCGGFGYTNPQAVIPQYFVLRLSKVPSSAGFFKKQPPMQAEAAWDAYAGKYKVYTQYFGEMGGDDIGCWFSFDTREGESICVQVGVSFVSCANARENLEAEQDGFNFDSVRLRALDAWESALSRIRVDGGTEEQRQVFYTSLYHALIHPNILNDVNGEYPLFRKGGTGRVENGHDRYTVYSLWDTYRNVHQLLTLVYPEKQLDMVRSMVDMYKESGWMPKWELYGTETYIMEGDPAIPIIADSYLKGITGFDVEAAYEAFLKSAETPGNPLRPDNVPYNEKGYIPLGFFAADFSGDNSVSHALEYYVADAALSRLAAALGRNEDALKYRMRSLGYRHYYSAESGTMRPLEADGSFLEPFNPRQGENFEPVPGFHEGSAWNYTFYVPHDIEGLAKLMGGPKAFCEKLQRVFDEGLYDPANEPDIAYPYLFSRFRGYEDRTAKIVDALLEKYFRVAPDGIPGNDDTGTMSAWAVFSMMGLYPDCPGEPAYTLTTPTFDKVVIGDTITLSKTSGRRIRGIRAGGRALSGRRISHEDLIKAKNIEFRCR